MKLSNQDLIGLAILVLLVFLLVLIVVVFFYLKSEGGMCLVDPLQYAAQRTEVETHCYCLRNPFPNN